MRSMFRCVMMLCVPVVMSSLLTRHTQAQTPEDTLLSVNQVGYFVDAPKYAVYGANQAVSEEWLLKDHATGDVVARGMISSGAYDGASGYIVHQVDFSDFNQSGTYVIQVGQSISPVFKIADSLYHTLQADALAYYYHNRSGIEIEARFVGDAHARPAGHLSDHDVTCYRGTDADGRNWDGCDYILDAGKGWYDAGDHGKYVVNSGISTWTLLNLYEMFPERFQAYKMPIPESGNGTPDLLNEARWNVEFMLGMQVPDGYPLSGMAHHKLHDVRWTGLPHLPEQHLSDDERQLMPPSTAATLNLAAVGAQCARIYQPFDEQFASRCLEVAEKAWRSALENPSILAGNTPGQGGGNYDDNRLEDEFYWASAELYITTQKPEYHDYLTNSPLFSQLDSLNRAYGMAWADVGALGSLSLVTVPNGLSDDSIERIRSQVIAVADGYLQLMEAGYHVPFRQHEYVWGSNSGVLNNSILLAYAHHFTGEQRYRDGVIATMDYILGRNATGYSFVTGYGERAVQNLHHRFWANEPENGFPPAPAGALSGGPNGYPSDPAIDAVKDQLQFPARMFVDDRESYSTNEVTINWNAPLVWAVTYLNHIFEK